MAIIFVILELFPKQHILTKRAIIICHVPFIGSPKCFVFAYLMQHESKIIPNFALSGQKVFEFIKEKVLGVIFCHI